MSWYDSKLDKDRYSALNRDVNYTIQYSNQTLGFQDNSKDKTKKRKSEETLRKESQQKKPNKDSKKPIKNKPTKVTKDNFL